MKLLLLVNKLLIESFVTAKTIFLKQEIEPKVVDEVLDTYKKLCSQRKIKAPENDLTFWYSKNRPFAELKKFVEDKLKEKTTTQIKKEQKHKGADVVLENDNFLILRIKTFEASKLYGKGTEWCISGDNAKCKEQYDDYRELQMEFFFVFDKSKGSEDPLYKIAVSSFPTYPNEDPILEIVSAPNKIISNLNFNKYLKENNLDRKLFANYHEEDIETE